jgi:hypothetical protein
VTSRLLVVEPGKTLIAREYGRLRLALGRAPQAYGAFDGHAYDPVSVAAARAGFKRRMVDEYESTTVYSSLCSQLMEANATVDACAVVLRMAQDEFRHAEICGSVVTSLGGNKRVMRDTAVTPIAVNAGCSPEERALRNVIVTSISEMYSVAWFVASLERLVDPYLRAVTRDLLADEVLHGSFGFYYLQDWSEVLGAHPEIRHSISRYLRYVFAVSERASVGDRQPRALGADASALGLIAYDEARSIFENTMEAVVAPALERFGLSALASWKTRALA